MANKERGEVTLKLGGKRYTLRPEFGVIAEIEDALETDMFQLGMKAEQFKFRVRDLVRTIHAVLAANGYKIDEKHLAQAIAREGMAAVMVPPVAFVRAYILGGQPEKKDSEPAPEATEDAASLPPNSSPNA